LEKLMSGEKEFDAVKYMGQHRMAFAELNNMYMTGKDIDSVVKRVSYTVSEGINIAMGLRIPNDRISIRSVSGRQQNAASDHKEQRRPMHVPLTHFYRFCSEEGQLYCVRRNQYSHGKIICGITNQRKRAGIYIGENVWEGEWRR